MERPKVGVGVIVVNNNNNNPRKYQHYKGNFYELLHEGKHSETHEEMVVLMAGKFPGSDLWNNFLN